MSEKNKKDSKGEEEINIDFEKVKKFYNQHSKVIITILLLIIPIFFSIFFRAYPADLPITDQWAQNTVYNNVKSNILNQVNQQYPNLPDSNKQKLVNEQIEELREQNSAELNAQVKELSEYFKSKMKDETGQTYLLAIDPYFYLRHVQNCLEYGQTGTIYTNEIEDTSAQELVYPNINFDKKINWDGQRMAPIGASTKQNFHDSFGIFLHKFLSFFNKDQTVMATMFLIPIIICSLAVIPAFFIGKRVAGNIGGFVSGTILAINSNLLGRTAGGFSDTDSYNILFPLLISWLFIESLIQKDTKKRIMFASLSGLATGLFSFAWIGWWYMFDFILASIGIYVVYLVIKYLREGKKISKILKDKQFLPYIRSAASYVIASGVFVTIFSSFKSFLISVTNPLNFLAFKSVATKSLWPTIQTTVAELNAASFNTIISSVGGTLFFWIAIIGIALMFILRRRQKEISVQMSILLSLWFLGTIYASKSGVRFVLLLIPAFAVAFGTSIGLIFKKAGVWAQKSLELDKKIAQVIMIILLAVLFIQPLQAAHSVARREVPSMNDAWYQTLDKIDQEASEDAIINSWWDFGHWFITIADRRTTFDGAGQDRYMAYWIGRSLLSDNEEKTAGILRMADCGNNNAFIALNNEMNDTPKSIDILNNIILKDKEEAKEELLKYVSQEKADQVLKYSHCDPPENYYITSEDMVGKSGVWAHFGSWDFKKASMYKDVKKLKEAEGVQILTEEYGLDQDTASRYYYQIQNTEADQWISPWPSYVSSSSSCSVDESQIICTANVGGQGVRFIIDAETMDTRLDAQTDEVLRPHSVVYADEEKGIVEKEYNSSDFPYTIAIYPTDSGFRNIVMYPELAESTFTKLFFFKGHGQKCFSLFSEATQVTGGKIYVWKVDWQCAQDNNVLADITPQQIKASHILISTENRTSEQANDIIEEIEAQATPENFAQLATQYSNCPSSEQGGDLGYFEKGAMIPEFEEVAFSLDAGDISEPVLTQFGYHLIYRTE